MHRKNQQNNRRVGWGLLKKTTCDNQLKWHPQWVSDDLENNVQEAGTSALGMHCTQHCVNRLQIWIWVLLFGPRLNTMFRALLPKVVYQFYPSLDVNHFGILCHCSMSVVANSIASAALWSAQTCASSHRFALLLPCGVSCCHCSTFIHSGKALGAFTLANSLLALDRWPLSYTPGTDLSLQHLDRLLSNIGTLSSQTGVF